MIRKRKAKLRGILVIAALFIIAGSIFGYYYQTLKGQVNSSEKTNVASGITPQQLLAKDEDFLSYILSGDCNLPEVLSQLSNLERVNEKEEFKTVLFAGDIMLDRGVEVLMNENNVFYPFEKISQFLQESDVVVGNLEGLIIGNPPDFGLHSLQFVFSPDVIEGLSFANFNLLSLANNHTSDRGEAGVKETKDFLAKANINSFGHPVKCDDDFLFERDNIIFLTFNKTFSFNCSDEKIINIVKETRNTNLKKFLVVMFHWGEEYQPKSSLIQQKLAHQIIDAGADLIIGHHPHVVQEVEEYKGKLIFYSLGNFIFDQYFSEAVQQGLAVGLELYPEKVVYRLFPVQSRLSQPALMEKEAADRFLEELSRKSSPELSGKIKEGIIKGVLVVD